MNTIERNETSENATPPESQILDTTSTDLFPLVATEQANLTELRSSKLTIAQRVSHQHSRTLQRQIFLTILPFIVLPIAISGWMMFHEINEHNSADREQIAHQNVESHSRIDLIILLSMGCINLGAAIWMTRRLSNSFKQVTAKLTDAANGNLSVQLESGDTAEFQELAESFNQLVANFSQTLQQQQLAAQANKLFGRVALRAQESVDLLQVYNTGVIGIAEILKVDRVSIYRCNRDGSAVVVAESVASGYQPTLSTSIGQMYFAESPAELKRYQQGEIVEIDDLQQIQITPQRRDLFAKMQVRSILSIPILAGKQLVGLLVIHQCSRVRQWQPWEVSFGNQAALRLGLAVEQITTWNIQAVELRRTNMLSQALQLNEPVELTDLLDRALEIIRQEFNLDRVMVLDLCDVRAGQEIATAVKPGCLMIDEAAIGQYLDYEFERNDLEPEQISSIYNLDDSGGLKANEIELLENFQIRARLVAPISVEGRLLGLVVGHMCTEDRQWKPAEIDKFAIVANKIGLVIDRRNSIGQRADRLHYKNLLSEIILKLRESLDRDEIIATALTNLRQNFGLDRAIFISLNENSPATIVAESLAPGNLSILGEVVDNSLLEQAQISGSQKGQITAIEDIYREGFNAAQIQQIESFQARASIMMPIVVNTKSIGLIIGDMCHGTRMWEPVVVETIGEIATQIGLVLNQAQLFAQRENDARRSQIISNFTLQLRQSLKRKDILTTAVELVRHALDLDRAIIFELDSALNGTIAAESVAAGKLSIIGQHIEDCCIKDAGYAQGKFTAFADIYHSGLTDCHIQMLEKLQVRANLVVPISVDGHLFGLFIAHECQLPRAWQPEEIDLFNQLSTQLALALNQVLLLEQREAAAKQAQFLSEITLKLRQSIDETKILSIALPEIRTALGVDRASILVVDNHGEGEGKIIAESIASAEFSIMGATVAAEYMFEVFGRGYQEGSFIQVNDLQVSDFSAALISHLQRINIKSIVTTPIIVNNKFFGLFSITMCRSPRDWQPSEIDLLLQIATQIGVALTQSQLVRQLEAANLQQSGYAASQEAARQILQKNAWDLLIQVDRISQGDLTIRAHVTEDEIGTIADSYNSTVASLRRLVNDVRNVSQKVVSTTNLNEISVAELSIEALQQSEDIDSALHRLREMSGSIDLVVSNALVAESAVMESAKLVQAGDAAMNLAVEGILTIRNTVAETAKKVKRLGESSQKISKVVNLISSFAAQTNLLALNASIEAARAGEEGRGFAVVAEEVRSLARQSATATGEIENLVASIQAQTSEVVMAMEAGTEQVIIGTRLVDETRASLDRITAIGAKIGELVESIAQAALVQSESSVQVTHSIDRVANIATKTSTRADNVQASFQDLIQLSQELQQNIGQFKIE
ncbi:GAF domain-containing protein [Chamaesiphon sp. VAR_48_metabat_135_sub]|uniref:GAF domain-containing protein n=1 Tax=Chamaesiphon sp. VAR_48_metabat_135_sub TaxID=2964699 RepID=UPI00286D2D79|nr:GAF domain-containing protein [Chamaesiphon sp. VAR_48_metabat_135_sub]